MTMHEFIVLCYIIQHTKKEGNEKFSFVPFVKYY